MVTKPLVTVMLALAPACTHWETTTTYGPRREVGRRLIGAPRMEDGSAGSVARARCVREAEIEYEQPARIIGQVEGRPIDAVGGAVTGFFGLVAMVGAGTSAGDGGGTGPGDPADGPSTAGLIIGGAMLAGGVGWIVYSYKKLPRGPAPRAQETTRRWTATELVEAIGCGQLPAER